MAEQSRRVDPSVVSSPTVALTKHDAVLELEPNRIAPGWHTQRHHQGVLAAVHPPGRRAGPRDGPGVQRQQQEARLRHGQEQGERELFPECAAVPLPSLCVFLFSLLFFAPNFACLSPDPLNFWHGRYTQPTTKHVRLQEISFYNIPTEKESKAGAKPELLKSFPSGHEELVTKILLLDVDRVGRAPAPRECRSAFFFWRANLANSRRSAFQAGSSEIGGLVGPP